MDSSNKDIPYLKTLLNSKLNQIKSEVQEMEILTKKLFFIKFIQKSEGNEDVNRLEEELDKMMCEHLKNCSSLKQYFVEFKEAAKKQECDVVQFEKDYSIMIEIMEKALNQLTSDE